MIVDPGGVPAGTRVVQQQLAGIENRADRVRSSVGDKLRNEFKRTFAFLAGGALIVGAVRSIAKFEESIATARAVTGATAREFELLRDRAQELGVSTRFSATQAGDALVNLARAGFSVREAIEAVDDTLQLAQAGGLGLAQAADIAASTLRGFRLEVDQATRVTDVLVETANRANTNVEQLGEGIKFVAPIAAGLGQKLELTSAALGVLSDAGLKATLAGTGLRRVLAELESPSTTSTKTLAALGVKTDEVRVSQVGLVGALERLQQAGVDTGTALEIFGQRGGPAFEVLVNNIPRLKQLNEQLENSAGVAKRVSGIIDNTLNGALFRARSAIEGFVLALGQAGTSTVLIGILDTVSSLFRFLAENANLVTAALLGLAAALTIKLTAGFVAARVAATGFGAALNALSAFTGIPIGLATSSFIGFGTAVATATVSLQFQAKLLKEIDQSFENLAEDANFARIGTEIRQIEQELRLLDRQVKARGELGPTEGQLRRIQQLETALAAARGEAKKTADTAKELAEAQAAQAVTTENLIARLEREAAALRNSSRETELRTRYEEELQKLLQAGQVPTAAERERIEALIKGNAELKLQAQILEEIRGPQEELRQKEAALNALRSAGIITVEELTAKLRELKGELSDVATVSDTNFKNALVSLEMENKLLSIKLRQGDIAAEAQRIENQLLEDGEVINDEIRKRILEAVLAKQMYTAEIKKANDADREAKRLVEEQGRNSQREQQRIERLATQVNFARQLEEGERRLIAAKEQGLITDEQAAKGIADLQLRGLEASTQLGDGFSRAFAKISREAEDLAAVGEKVVGVFADTATDALVKFATEGTFQFKEFARSILADLTRIIARLLVVQALNAAFGGGAGTTAGAAAGLAGRAEGGTVQPARSFVVGENGPELFVPNRTGTIVPNQANAPQAQPVSVQVVNVQDPNEVPKMIASGAATDAIINQLAANKDRVNQVLR